MRIICFFLVLSGGLVMLFSARDYTVFARKVMVTVCPQNDSTKVLWNISRFLPYFFLFGYIIGALHILLTPELQLIDPFISLVFFLAQFLYSQW